VIQKWFDVNANYLMMAAEMMPESSCAFRPTPDVRTFGEQITHAAGAHYSFCNQAGLPPGVERQTAPSFRAMTAKTEIVKALKDSVAEDYGTITTHMRMQGLVPPSTALHPAVPATTSR
jgi:hypothetical protein